ncbi:MAG: EscU/YscU/HrcU family type III secretion system export apparatus switch protein [Parvularcula sp.]
MSGDDDQDKSFDATPERIKKARKKGNIPISADIAALLSYVGFWLGLSGVGMFAVRVGERLVAFYRYPDEISAALLSGTYSEGGLITAPLFLIGVLIVPGALLVLLGLIVQNAIVFSPTKIQFDLQRIDPIKGFQKKYGLTGLLEFLKAAFKVLVAAGVGGLYLWSRRDAYIALGTEGFAALPQLMRREIMQIIAIAIGVSLIAALADYPLKRADHLKRLRMSRQEVTDENKEMEGDPTQKKARRARAEAISNNRMLHDTASADVVIVNPTHFAVALTWDRGRDTVPICVAKGRDHLALAIKQKAKDNGVPVREDPPCARALHASVDVGEPIRPEHFAAVAAAIRFAESVRPRL